MSTEPANLCFRVVVLGSGIDAAMAAAVLARSLPAKAFQITLVRTRETTPSFSPVEATLPSIRSFHAALGIDEDAVLQVASGCFSLGTAYAGWSGAAGAYFAPHGDIGSAFDGVAFHQLALRLRAAGGRIRLADYSIAALLAQAGRFAHPLDDPRSPLSAYSYGLHLGISGYSQMLLGIAEVAGTRFAPAPFDTVELAPDGGIAAVRCSDGARLEADLFVDASGPDSLVARGATEARFESWSEWLPCDRVLQLESRSDVAPAPYALVSAQRFGWRRTVPGRRVLGECLAYASHAVGDDEANNLLLSHALGTPASEPVLAELEPGRLAQPWRGRCVAVGGAAATLEPTAATSLHLLQMQLERLASLFPSAGADPDVLRREYNRLTCQELDRTRDFVMLRYCLNRRAGEPLWDAAREMTLPAELAHKIAEYRRRGHVPMFDGDLFDEIEWALVFDEQGVRPGRYAVLADTVPLDTLKAQFARMRQLMLTAIGNVPRHGDYLERRQRSAAA